MSKSTPLNQLPSFADAPSDASQEQQPIKQEQYRFQADDDATVQEVMGDLASSIPGFVPPPSEPVKRQPSASPFPIAPPAALAPATKPQSAVGMFSNPLTSASLLPASLLPTLNNNLWLGLITAILFLLVTVSPIDKLLATIPSLAKYTSYHVVVLLRSVIMGISTVAAMQFVE